MNNSNISWKIVDRLLYLIIDDKYVRSALAEYLKVRIRNLTWKEHTDFDSIYRCARICNSLCKGGNVYLSREDADQIISLHTLPMAYEVSDKDILWLIESFKHEVQNTEIIETGHMIGMAEDIAVNLIKDMTL